MAKGILAMIIPIDQGAHPDQGLPTPQPPPGGSGAHPDHTLPGDLPIPSHPIYYPLPPGAPVDPSYGIPEDGPHPDQGLPGSQPRPDHDLPPFPSHPIVLPPGGNGGWLPVYIDNTLPGAGSAGGEHPDQGLPGSQPRPDQGLPPFPSHPIVLPPDGVTEDGAQIKWKAMWTSATGWVSFAIVVPGGGTPVPTPSKRK